MYLKLRVLCTILSAVCIAFALTAGAIWGVIWFGVLALGAVLFFLLMRLFKQYQEAEEAKKNEEKQPTFFEPAPSTEPATEETKNQD